MSAIDYERARFNMVEQQIRPWEVLDQRVLDTVAEVPREDFVPERYRRLAFADVRIPLGHGQVMMNPNVEGRLLQALALSPSERVLEVGTGSGYLSACLARLSRHVDSVDIYPEFSDRARAALKRHAVNNVGLYSADAAHGWDENDDLYDAIALTAALPAVPQGWKRRLAVGGRLFVIVGAPPIMEAMLITRVGNNEESGEWSEESLFETELPYMVNAERPVEFEF